MLDGTGSWLQQLWEFVLEITYLGNPNVRFQLWNATKETLYMVAGSTLFGNLLGIPLGVLLTVTRPNHILPNAFVHRLVGFIVNIGRSVPTLILMVAIIPFTKWVVGTYIGTTAAIVPLTVAAIPFVARLVEAALTEVDPGVIEAAQSMGATPLQIIFKVMLRESLPALVSAVTVTTVNLISHSALAGAIGAGGLGDLAIRYGFHRFRVDIMIHTVIIMVLLVQLVQSIGNRLARMLDHRHPS